MAVRIPIVVDYNGKALGRIRREFAQLDGAAAKTKYALRKAIMPATAAMAGLATVAVASMDAAIQDQKAQQSLARSLKNTLGATDAQIAASEEWIAVQGKTLGITDDELRPAYAKLTRSVKDTTKTQKLLSLAFDISRGTGADLSDTTDALAKAYNNNFKSLKALAPELSGLIKDGATADQVFDTLGKTFKNSAAEYANTAAGRMEILKLRFSELFEQLGTAFLPAFDKLMPYFERFATWLEQNPDKIAALATGVGKVAEVMLNLPGKIGSAIDALKRGFENFLNWIIDKLNKFLNAVDVALGPLINIGVIPDVNFTGMKSKLPNTSTLYDLPPGIQGPTLSSAYKPLPPGIQGPVANRYQNIGAYGRDTRERPNITINVNGGDPKAVVDAIVRWSRQNGKLPPQIQTAG